MEDDPASGVLAGDPTVHTTTSTGHDTHLSTGEPWCWLSRSCLACHTGTRGGACLPAPDSAARGRRHDGLLNDPVDVCWAQAGAQARRAARLGSSPVWGWSCLAAQSRSWTAIAQPPCCCALGLSGLLRPVWLSCVSLKVWSNALSAHCLLSQTPAALYAAPSPWAWGCGWRLSAWHSMACWCN